MKKYELILSIVILPLSFLFWLLLLSILNKMISPHALFILFGMSLSFSLSLSLSFSLSLSLFDIEYQFNNVYSSLLGVYGDVLRVKILYSKRDSALIQFRESQQAQNG